MHTNQQISMLAHAMPTAKQPEVPSDKRRGKLGEADETMSIQPHIIERIGKKDVEIDLHGQEIKVIYDPKKFAVYFGVCDSGSSLHFRVDPK